MEWNKSRRESRTLLTAPVLPEDVGFPMAAQVARLRRQTKGRKDELVCLITSLHLEQLNAPQWLQHNRQAWGIENGLHQRLDISQADDRCRIRFPRAMRVIGMFRRLATSLFMEWRSHFHKPERKSMTDFHSEMGEENLRNALRFVKSKRASLKNGP